jgi:hypothetical protein
MLALDDPRWQTLASRSGLDRRPLSVPAALKHIREHPEPDDIFDHLWPDLCSEDTPYPAAYAAAPYLVEIAGQRSPLRALDYVLFLGYLESLTQRSEVDPQDRADYAAAIEAAAAIARSIAELHDVAPKEFALLLGSLAAFEGRYRLSELLLSLGTYGEFEVECPTCGRNLHLVAVGDSFQLCAKPGCPCHWERPAANRTGTSVVTTAGAAAAADDAIPPADMDWAIRYCDAHRQERLGRWMESLCSDRACANCGVSRPFVAVLDLAGWFRR